MHMSWKSFLRPVWLAAFCLAIMPALVSAQTRRVSGQITVQGTTEGVAGATIQLVGTTVGVVADEQGRFAISLPAGAQQLRVRRLGFQAKLVSVTAESTTMNVVLTADVLRLEEQVITGQTTTIDKAHAANAITVVNGEQLNRVPQPTVDNALVGKVPGAVITTNSGAPGGGVQLQIRGTNTVNGAYQPLYVVDGTIVNNDAYSNGMQSITRAGAGGSGQIGALVTSNQDQQVNRIADLVPEDIESIEILKGPSAGAIYGSRGANGVVIITTKRGIAGRPSFSVTQSLGTAQLSNKFDLKCFTQQEATDYVNAHMGPGSATGYFAQYPYAGCVDPQDQLYGNNGLSYETAASVRGGTTDGATTYFSSLSAKHDASIAKGDGYDKQGLLVNLAQRLGDQFSVNANSNLLHTLTKRGIQGNDNTSVVPINVYSATPTFFNFAQRNPDGSYVSNPWVSRGTNILQDQQAFQTPEEVFRLLGSAQAEWSVLSSATQRLDATLLGGIDNLSDHSMFYSPPTTYFEQSAANPGTLVKNATTATNANLNFSVIHKYMAQPFTATTSVGLREERRQSDYRTNAGKGLYPGITNVATAVTSAVAEGQSLTKALSYYAQEEFQTLADRLTLTAAVNAERSSSNGDADKFFTYPKFSASYRLPWLPAYTDNLKLRVAYGRAGNQVPVDFKYTYLTALLEDGINGLLPSSQVGLSSVRPEQTAETEGGFDATFLDGRAGLEFTYYSKKTTDLVLQSAPAPSTGFTSQVINGGSLTNKGTELSINLIPIQNRLLTWNSVTTYSANSAKVTSLPVPPFLTGSAIGQNFGIYKIQVGYSPTQILAYGGSDTVDAHFKDENPDFVMGFSNDFTLGAFQIGSVFDWRHGGYLVDLTQITLDFNGALADTAGTSKRLAGFFANEAPYTQRATFVKLRELSISYDISPRFVQPLFAGRAQSVRLKFAGRNLKTWTKYPGLDPEVSNYSNAAIGRSQDIYPYPPSRQFTFSVNATF